ncbi:MAG: sugar phosphate isomerase/epimerase [bacterium]|nr:sugar phosphate isomerase/epimerase [bacterium]
MSIEEQIGISTISLPAINTEEAIDAVAEAGFKAIELILSIGNQCAIGYPDRVSPSPGIWPRTCSKERRKKIKEKLKPFLYVTTHVQLEGTNIASPNPGIREETVKQYIECIEFTHDIGVSMVTFHPRGGCRHSQYEHMYKEDGDRYNLDFAKKALKYAHKYDLQMGYEGTHGAGWPVRDLILKIKDKRFGILIDPTQSCLRSVPVSYLIESIRKCKGRICEIHVHGALCRTINITSHLPLRLNNIVDWKQVLSVLTDVNFKGPFMFEITSSEDYRTVIKDCQESKDLLIKWQREIDGKR